MPEGGDCASFLVYRPNGSDEWGGGKGRQLVSEVTKRSLALGPAGGVAGNSGGSQASSKLSVSYTVIRGVVMYYKMYRSNSRLGMLSQFFN